MAAGAGEVSSVIAWNSPPGTLVIRPEGAGECVRRSLSTQRRQEIGVHLQMAPGLAQVGDEM